VNQAAATFVAHAGQQWLAQDAPARDICSSAPTSPEEVPPMISADRNGAASTPLRLLKQVTIR
jgi:hypothetical protein